MQPMPGGFRVRTFLGFKGLNRLNWGAMEGETYDISAGGLRFESNLDLSVGTELEFALRFSSSFAPTVSGKVLRVDKVEDETEESHKYVAVQFQELEPDVKAKISKVFGPDLQISDK